MTVRADAQRNIPAMTDTVFYIFMFLSTGSNRINRQINYTMEFSKNQGVNLSFFKAG